MASEKWYPTFYDLIVAAKEIADDCAKIYRGLAPSDREPLYIYGVPRGGIPASYLVLLMMKIHHADIPASIVCEHKNCNIIVDDVIDLGKTRGKYLTYRGPRFSALFDKTDPRCGNIKDKWIVFPWEHSETQDTSGDDICLRLLQYIGEDPNRGGLKETPQRFLKAWKEYTSGYNVDPATILKTFEDGAEGYDEMVLVKNIPIYSHCEHHLAPFFGVAHIAYIPDKRVVGLSKLPRLADIFMRRLQIQERLTQQIADALMKHLQPKGVAVVLDCRHFCMECRGTKLQGVSTTTSKMLGVFMEKPEARNEFMGLIK